MSVRQKDITLTLQNNDVVDVDVRCGFVKFKTGTVAINFYANKGGDFVAMNQGDKAIASLLGQDKFDGFKLENKSGGAATITFIIGDGDFQNQQFSGVVTITSTVPPTGSGHTPASFGVTNVSQQVKAANAARKYLFLQNPRGSANSVWVRGDGAAATANTASAELQPGDVWEPTVPPIGAVTAISTVAGPTNIHVIEA